MWIQTTVCARNALPMKRRVHSGLFSVVCRISTIYSTIYIVCVALLISPFVSTHAGAEVARSKNDPAAVPDTPNAPPSLFKGSAPESFRCQRTFVYNGKIIGCDSNVRPDGEGLRPYLADVPAANAELNTYQRNRASLRNTAYFGSLGLAVLLAGAVAGGGTGKQLLLLGGGSIMAGSFLYGFTTLRTNENHLNEAVRLHNLAKPDKPIELQFSTGIGF
jgi:hypothetical protein